MANKIIIAMLSASADKAERAALAKGDFADKNPNATPEQISRFVTQWNKDNPAFNTPELKQALADAKAAQAKTSAAPTRFGPAATPPAQNDAVSRADAILGLR